MRFNCFSSRLLSLGALILGLSACSSLPSADQPALFSQVSLSEAVPAMPTGGETMPPSGLLGFCVKHLSDCAATTSNVPAVDLTAQRLRQLQSVQTSVNAAIVAAEVPNNAWDYPINGYGECNQYALEKRRQLIALGWSRGDLLLTSALTEHGEGHLVLLVRTSSGDVVLDNRVSEVVSWTSLPYQWLAQQSEQSLVKWVSVVDPSKTRPAVASAAAASPTQFD